jgi:predicted nucleic acid-binding protein
MTHSVLLDTSFFIRLLNDEDPLHHNAKDYF